MTVINAITFFNRLTALVICLFHEYTIDLETVNNDTLKKAKCAFREVHEADLTILH